MRILYLGPAIDEIFEYLSSFGDEVINTEEPLTIDSPILEGIDFIISYGYRHILRKVVLDKFPSRAINLHISLLPWNRGSDPNLWSFLENSPKGVTIHYLDVGVDTGDILAQIAVDFEENDTLRTTYERLNDRIEQLFYEIWPLVRTGKLSAKPQEGIGSVHKLKDKASFVHLLIQGWDTPICGLIGRALSPDDDRRSSS